MNTGAPPSRGVVYAYPPMASPYGGPYGGPAADYRAVPPQPQEYYYSGNIRPQHHGYPTYYPPPAHMMHPGAPMPTQTAPPMAQPPPPVSVARPVSSAQVFKCSICKCAFTTQSLLEHHIVKIELPGYRPCECRPCGEIVVDEHAYNMHCDNLRDKNHEFVDNRDSSEQKRNRDRFHTILSSSLNGRRSTNDDHHGVPVAAPYISSDTTSQVTGSGNRPVNDANGRSDSPEILALPPPTNAASRSTTKPVRGTTMECQLCGKIVRKQHARSHIYVFHIGHDTVFCSADGCNVAFRYSVIRMKKHIKSAHPDQGLKPRNQKGRHVLKAKYLEPKCFPGLKDCVKWVVQPEEMQLSSGGEDDGQYENSDGDDSDDSEDGRSSDDEPPVSDAGGSQLITAVRQKDLAGVKRLLASGVDVNAQESTEAGQTALHVACKENLAEIAIALIEGGADPDKRNSLDLGALDSAKPGLQKKLEKYLQKRRAAEKTAARKADGASKKRGRPPAKAKPAPASKRRKADDDSGEEANGGSSDDENAASDSDSPYVSSDNDDETAPTPATRRLSQRTRKKAASNDDDSPPADSDGDEEPMSDGATGGTKQCRVCTTKTGNPLEHAWFHLGKEGHPRFECRVKVKGSGQCATQFYVEATFRRHIKEEHSEHGDDAKPKNNEKRYKKEFMVMRRRCFG